MKCTQAKLLFSPYLDGAITGTQMQELTAHFQSCAGCKKEYQQLQQTQQLLANLGRKKAPADLALRLRVAISQEVAQSRGTYFDGLSIRMQNAVNAFMVPATAGLVTAVLIFGLLMGSMTVPLRANNADVPLMVHTAPQLQHSAFEMNLNNIQDDSLVIEAYVDATGRVQDYRILSSPQGPRDLSPEAKNMLLLFTTFTTFRPAMTMGRPTPGTAVLSFSKISVKG